ncbi:MAG: DNA-3-methyladenine glycosylase [Saprospiraceae bacterium]|nr:DNA-3-methyladenine glycosylase [Saprospiraceae bacterium]
MLLPQDYYLTDDVVALARDLLGRHLVTNIEGVTTVGIITETEAYRGPEDRGSHAWNNRRTNRTEIMFGPGGHAYIYLCYGIHQMFNVVSGPEDMPHAILIRAMEPVTGIESMLERRKLIAPRKQWTGGPGTATQALGLHTRLTGTSLFDPASSIQLHAGDARPQPQDIQVGPRVGIEYAGEDAHLPWRFQWLSPR